MSRMNISVFVYPVTGQGGPQWAAEIPTELPAEQIVGKGRTQAEALRKLARKIDMSDYNDIRDVTVKLEKEIEEVANLDEDYEGMRREVIRQLILKTAFNLACEIIHTYADESEEEYRFVVAEVASLFADKMHGWASSDLLKHDLERRLHDEDIPPGHTRPLAPCEGD